MMEILLAIGTVLLLCAACVGLGGTILHLTGVARDLTMLSRVIWSFPIGLGSLGWLVFFPAALGYLTAPVLTAICVTAAAGTVFLTRHAVPGSRPSPKEQMWATTAGWLLCAAALIVMGGDILEGLSPPADADTLAYHFALPIRHLTEGTLVAVPRAVDGVLPQLIQMSYTVALGIGGERAVTLWTMVSGWATAVLLFEICRRYIGFSWSLAVAVIYLSTPTVLQTGGAGYVEPRIAQFVLIAALSAGIAVYRNNTAYAQLAGICAGFFAGTKYTGLLFCFAGALIMLIGTGRWKRTLYFGVFAFIAGCQWYAWIWFQSGDPVFPMLYNILGAEPGWWSAAQDELFRSALDSERPLGITLWWFIAYPFFVTFSNLPVLETGRTGLGVMPVILLPFAIGWLISEWTKQWMSPLAVTSFFIALFYLCWFFGGSPQRVRHLLPIYPVVLLCLAVPAVRWVDRTGLRGPLIAGIGLCIGVQLAGQIYFGLNYARHVFSSETRARYYERNVALSPLIFWFNDHRKQGDKILVFNRELLYLAEGKAELSLSHAQQKFNFIRLEDRPDLLYRELRDAKITHLLAKGHTLNGPGEGPLYIENRALRKMLEAGCMKELRRKAIAPIGSRTMRVVGGSKFLYGLYQFVDHSCRL